MTMPEFAYTAMVKDAAFVETQLELAIHVVFFWYVTRKQQMPYQMDQLQWLHRQVSTISMQDSVLGPHPPRTCRPRDRKLSPKTVRIAARNSLEKN